MLHDVKKLNMLLCGCYIILKILEQKFELDIILEKEKKIITAKFNDYYYIKILINLSKILDLSLRQIEQIFTHLHIIFKTLDIDREITPYHINIIVILTMIKAYDSNLYFQLIKLSTSKNRENFINTFYDKFEKHKVNKESLLSIFLEIIINTVNLNYEEYKLYIHNLKHFLDEAKEKHYIKEEQKLQNLLEIANNAYKYEYNGFSDIIDYAIKKVEFADSFSI